MVMRGASGRVLRRLSCSASAHLPTVSPNGTSRTFFIESYGCAMNTSDSEIVASILLKAGHTRAKGVTDASLILVNTCAIRENAEAKVWNRLAYFQSLRKSRRIAGGSPDTVVGVLGCMAERLKEKLLDEESVDFVAGPDAYRDVPRLVLGCSSTGQKEANTRLSLDETYAEISPAREQGAAGAFVSIMRGCNNMCSYCIVPFTRGRERSRSMASILDEIRQLVDDKDSLVKEVVLLGQNVNGYHDTSPESAIMFPDANVYKTAFGFNSLYRSRKMEAPGARFAHLLEAVSDISPELRIRFTSPHPKDFPDEVLHVIAQRKNICKSLHLPAQSGSSSVLERMRRGYDRNSYIDLFRRARAIIPEVSISTDMISGFCGETEEEHQETLSLMEELQFDQAFMFAYSDREKTHAARTLKDDVHEDVKLRRLQEVIETFRIGLKEKNRATEWGAFRVVLVEGHSTRSTKDAPMLTGRTDGNKRVIFPQPTRLLLSAGSPHLPSIKDIVTHQFNSGVSGTDNFPQGTHMRSSFQLVTAAMDKIPIVDITTVSPSNALTGQYVLVWVAEANGPTLRGVALSNASC